MKKFETYKGAVLTWECDSNRHMNVMYYINKFESGGRQLSGKMGFTRAFLEEHNYGIAVVEQNIKYLKEVLEDDLLHIESHVVGYTHKVFEVQHEMFDSTTNKKVAEMNVKLVLLDKKLRKAAFLPTEIQEGLDLLI